MLYENWSNHIYGAPFHIHIIVLNIGGLHELLSMGLFKKEGIKLWIGIW